MATSKKQIPVLITTAHRGVFFGYIDPAQRHESIVDVTNVRNCLYWHSSVGGFLGLAVTGPSKESRVGAKIGNLTTTIRDVTLIAECTPEAVKAWEAL
jgi:hypothetical protein